MSKARIEYEKLAELLTATDSVSAGQMFGKSCLKVNGKAFVAQHMDFVVFKLTGSEHQKALSLHGSHLWDPSGKGRPMKKWIAVPGEECKVFKVLAAAALGYVSAA